MTNRRVTIKDVAAKAGVSVSLVSFVMSNQASGEAAGKYRVSGDTTRRILKVAAELNYQPNNSARALRSGQTKVVGVILSDISNKFFADIARCIEDRAFEHGYSALFGSTDESSVRLKNLTEVFLNKGVDGLILVPCESSDQTIHDIEQRNVPLVLLDREIAGGDLNSVVLNNTRAGMLATQALLRRGCRKIEMISYSMSLSNIRDREEGYSQALKEVGLGNACSIHRLRHNKLGKMHEIILDAHARGVDGILFATNTLAMAGLRAVSRSGLQIPADLCVATFDSAEAFDICNTDIIYIRQPIPQFSAEAFDLLLKLINQKDKMQSRMHIVLNPELVEPEGICAPAEY